MYSLTNKEVPLDIPLSGEHTKQLSQPLKEGTTEQKMDITSREKVKENGKEKKEEEE